MAADPVRPRIILQTGHTSRITGAVWTPDSRFIVTGGFDRQLILWDLAGHIVDRATLSSLGSGELEISEIKMAANGTGVSANALFANDEGGHSALTCNWTFGQAVTSECAFRARGPTDARERPRRLTAAGEAPAQIRQAWSASPDGRWILEVTKPGAPARTPSDLFLKVRPLQGPGPTTALIGSSVLSDAALAYLAGAVTEGQARATGAREDIDAAQAVVAGILEPRRTAADAKLGALSPSPDGRLLARLELAPGRSRPGRLQVFDLAKGVFLTSVALAPDYDRLAWQGSRTLVATSDLTSAPIALIDVDTGRVARSTAVLCFPVLLGDTGTIVGAGTGNCRAPGCQDVSRAIAGGGGGEDCTAIFAAAPRQGLWRIGKDGDRRELPTGTIPRESWVAELAPAERRKLRPRHITSVAASVESGLVAIGLSSGQDEGDATRLPDTETVAVLMAADGRLVSRLKPKGYIDAEGSFIRRPVFAVGGKVLVTINGAFPDTLAANAWNPVTGGNLKHFTDGMSTSTGEDGKVVEKPAFVEAFNTAISPDGAVLAIQDAAGRTYRFAITTAAKMGNPVELPPQPQSLGLQPRSPLVWSQVGQNEVRFQDQETGADLFTLYLFSGSRFFAIDAEGRYDTNLAPDSRALRWLMADDPFQSLAPQTFMRENYQPGLMRQLLDCAGQTTDVCRHPFPAVRPLRDLNRLLPSVTIRSVRAKAGSTLAEVSIDASEAIDMTRAKPRSGLRDLRLFRDGKLVAQWPAAGGSEAIACAGPCHTFTVALPTTHAPVVFTAYAFNEDRVKGETATFTYTAPTPPTPRARRAFVVAIGINAYDGIPGKSLSFAANDARAIGDALRAISPYEVVDIPLVAEVGHPSQATKTGLRALLALLATGDEGARAILKAQGIATDSLSQVTPDDVVVLSFAGHGWADRDGSFYLLPSDAQEDAAGAPILSTLISSSELSDWLRPLDAGEMAMIIDACHSAASVATANFKPGPMGDPGLGQLSFDKGIRILAATQSDDVALEDAGIGHGLLTFALAGEGVTPTGGRADLDGDGRITLDEWLLYASKRLPSLSEDVRVSRTKADAAKPAGFVFAARRQTAKPKPQEPSLFDFTGEPSKVILRSGVK